MVLASKGTEERWWGWSMGAKPLGMLLLMCRLLHPHLAACAASGSFEVMHRAVCLVFPAPENRKQQRSPGGSCSWEISSLTHFDLCLQERGKDSCTFPRPCAQFWELMGQTEADLGLGKWTAQQRGSLNDFPFHSSLYHSNLDIICSGSRTTTQMLVHKLRCEKWLLAMDACPPDVLLSRYYPLGLISCRSSPPPNNTALPGPDQDLFTTRRTSSCFQGLGTASPTHKAPSTHQVWVQNLSLSRAILHIKVSLVPPGPPGSLLRECVPLPGAAGHDGTRPGEGQVWLVSGARQGLCHGRSYPHQECQPLLLADHGSRLRGT